MRNKFTAQLEDIPVQASELVFQHGSLKNAKDLQHTRRGSAQSDNQVTWKDSMIKEEGEKEIHPEEVILIVEEAKTATPRSMQTSCFVIQQLREESSRCMTLPKSSHSGRINEIAIMAIMCSVH